VFVGGDGAARAPAAPPGGPPRGANGAAKDTVWFRMNVGRNRNADPRWLLPLICRRGHVTKREIGGIRILDRETKFEIARDAAGRFASAVRRRDDMDPEIRIEAIRTGGQSKRGGERSRPGAERHRPRGERARRRAAAEQPI
jgi:ATP-dependent RNA helicase DeaD